MTSSHRSIRSALDHLPSHTPRVFLIGGAQLYNLALASSPPSVDRVLLTRVTTNFDCDTFLTDFTRDESWSRASHRDLCDWVGFEVPENEVEEKGVKYRFEMWTLRQ